MIVVADTTPIHYLILIGEESILPKSFTKIVIPDSVMAEMGHPNAPERIRTWVSNPPLWCTIDSANDRLLSEISGLGSGETSAIALAIELGANAVLMDDRKAIREASRRNLTVLTTFALLELASRRGFLDLEEAIKDLSNTSFHMPPDDIIDEYLRRNR